MPTISRRFYTLLSSLSLFSAAALRTLSPSVAMAQSKLWTGVCVANENAVVGAGDVATIQGLQCLIANILSIALTVIGLAGFVMILIASFRYMLSGSNAKGTEAARNTVTYAIIGVVVALSAFIIVNLLAAFTGVDAIKVFTIPSYP